jgi:hypothetical protein
MNFYKWFHWHDLSNTFHDFLILRRLLQVVFRLQAHPEFRSAAQQAGNFQAHNRRQGFPLSENSMDHLARHAQRSCRGSNRQADFGKNILPEDQPDVLAASRSCVSSFPL